MTRPCGIKPTKKNNAYTKNELVNMAVSLRILDEDVARQYSLPELCKELGIDITTEGAVHCKNLSKKELIGEFREKLSQYSDEELQNMTKDDIKDIVFDLKCQLVIPDSFDDCNYDIDTLKAFARKLNVYYDSSANKEELCRLLQLYEFIEKNNVSYNTLVNPNWVDDPKEEYGCMIPFNEDLQIMEHQKMISRYMLKNRGLLVVHSVGSGKTLSAVTAIVCVLSKHYFARAVVITPKSLKVNFKNEFMKFGLDLDKAQNASKVQVFTYETFINYYEKHPDLHENTFVIIDEAHNLRSEIVMSKGGEGIKKGARALPIIEFAKKCFKVLLLTATPVVNRGEDLLNFIPMIYGEKNIDKYMHKRTSAPRRSVKNSSDDDDDDDDDNDPVYDNIKEAFKCKVSVFKVKEDDTYPKRINEELIKITMTDDYYKQYDLIATKQKLKVPYGHTTSQSFLIGLRIALNALDGENNPKIKHIVDFIISEADAGRKSLVFSNFKDAGMNLLRMSLDKLNRRNLYVYISGELSIKERQLAVSKINENKAKIILISRAGGEGLSLFEIRNIILMEPNWNPSVDEQIIGRAVRKNSHMKLPPSERNVRIWRYLLVIPPKYSKTMREFSADEQLYMLSYGKKLPKIKKYEDLLESLSIEKNKCVAEEDKYKISDEEFKRLKTVKKYKDEDEVKKEKKEVRYTAPMGLTSLAISKDDLGLKTYKKLAGIRDLTKEKERKLNRRILEFDSESEEEVDMGERKKIFDTDSESEEEVDLTRSMGKMNINDDSSSDEEVDMKNRRRTVIFDSSDSESE